MLASPAWETPCESVTDPQSAHLRHCGAALFFMSLGDPPEACSLQATTQITPNMGATEVIEPTNQIVSATTSLPRTSEITSQYQAPRSCTTPWRLEG